MEYRGLNGIFTAFDAPLMSLLMSLKSRSSVPEATLMDITGGREEFHNNIKLLDTPAKVPSLDQIRLIDSPIVALPSHQLLDSPSRFCNPSSTPKKRKPRTSQKAKSPIKRTNFAGSIASVTDDAENADNLEQYSAFDEGGFGNDYGGGEAADWGSSASSQPRKDVVNWNVDFEQLQSARQLELPKYWAEVAATPAGIIHLTEQLFALQDWNSRFGFLKVLFTFEKSLK